MEKSNCLINAEGISKRFNRFLLFRDLNFSVSSGQSLAVTGPNGSGKSTLLEILAGIKLPTGGRITYEIHQELVQKKNILKHTGFISPSINPYGDLTGHENARFSAGFKNDDKLDELLKQYNLYEHRNKKVKFYSSGMKQRLKFLLALINDPEVLMLDEPGTNLDTAGKEMIFSQLEIFRKEKLIIIATNDKAEADFCGKRISLG